MSHMKTSKGRSATLRYRHDGVSVSLHRKAGNKLVADLGCEHKQSSLHALVASALVLVMFFSTLFLFIYFFYIVSRHVVQSRCCCTFTKLSKVANSLLLNPLKVEEFRHTFTPSSPSFFFPTILPKRRLCITGSTAEPQHLASHVDTVAPSP